jgi:DNA mismatch repair protein MutL
MSIEILPPAEASRIAAGEVVEKPASLVREFLDNAIDAGARNIDLSIEGGGIKKVEVSDDGSGMTRADLEICCLEHATSKIRSLADLDACHTLGFRGEALAAAAACCSLEILSCAEGDCAYLLRAGLNGGTIEKGRRGRGTTIRACGLFDALPARKKFLKREGAEAARCRETFIQKSLPFPEINFRYFVNGKLTRVLPACKTLLDRFASATLDAEGAPAKAALREIAASGTGFKAVVVIGGPELRREDRRALFVYANKRRIDDWALTQALEYGVQGFFPNGSHPVGALFLDIDPSLVDFNVHPAKKEARFRDAGSIHHAVTNALRGFFRGSFAAVPAWTPAFESALEPGAETPTNPIKRPDYPRPSGSGYYTAERLPTTPYLSKPASWQTPSATPAQLARQAEDGIRFLGRVFGVFLLVQRGDSLYIIDQHAAHERILYDKFLNGGIARQPQLAPLVFHTDTPEDDAFLAAEKDALSRFGVVIEGGNGDWQITALPANWNAGDTETIQAILNLKNAGENSAERWAATIACHSAIRDGDYLDETAALELARAALDLPMERCPHGRPILMEITREQMLKAVRRVE